MVTRGNVIGYSLLSVLDPKAADAMIEAVQEDGKPTWLNQIRGRFLHPSNESFAKYANLSLGEDDEDDPLDPSRKEVVILSSGSSDWSLEGLTSCSARAGSAQGVVNEPVHEVVDDDDDEEVPMGPTDPLETRRKSKVDRPEEKEKRVEGKTAGISRKRPSTLPFLDYVVVSDTLSSLGTGEKPLGSDPDDRATLTAHMKKKALEDKKRKLDEQAAALLASKKARLQKEAPLAPSESEMIWVFLARNEVIFWRRYLLPPLLQRGDADAEHVGEGGGAGAGGASGTGFDGGDGKGKGVETGMESSETTPHQTIYTKRPPGGKGGATSGVVRSPQFENVHADSWDTHNPACDDLPHVPRWNLTQGSRMNVVGNCHDFFTLSLPPAERMFQKRRNRFELLDDHVRVGVNFFATSQEIVREWRVMGEETDEFEAEKKAFVEEREKFNAEKKGLMWRVSDAEEKLSHEKQVNATKQKDWEAACERTNAEMQSQRDAIVRLSGEKKKLAEEANQARVAFEKKEKEYIDRIAKLENLAKQKVSDCEAAERLLEEKVAECKASELLVEEISSDCKWLLSRAVPLVIPFV
ncbi:hypothetical protein HanRHA438_Chr13g0621731 [Helianthus annuus]|nr:hypothetical protein HanRHA438_Chr13g0621731 [Helianthus annuus]